MKAGAGILLINNGKVLLVKAGKKSRQIDGQISFPGGRVDPGESVEQTATRELAEETGLIAGKLIDFEGSYVETIVKLKHGEEFVSFKAFLTTDYSGGLRATEETEPFWIEINQARKLALFGKNNEILEAAIKFLKLYD